MWFNGRITLNCYKCEYDLRELIFNQQIVQSSLTVNIHSPCFVLLMIILSFIFVILCGHFEWKQICADSIVCLYLYCCWISIYQEKREDIPLTLPHVRVCHKDDIPLTLPHVRVCPKDDIPLTLPYVYICPKNDIPLTMPHVRVCPKDDIPLTLPHVRVCPKDDITLTLPPVRLSQG